MIIPDRSPFRIPATVFTSFIYGWFRPSIGEYLYIGSSGSIKRIHLHPIVGVVEPLQPEDEIHLWAAPKDVLGINKRLFIERLKPRWNVEHTGRKRVCQSKWYSADIGRWKPRDSSA